MSACVDRRILGKGVLEKTRLRDLHRLEGEAEFLGGPVDPRGARQIYTIDRQHVVRPEA